ncbi:hypothetical protein SLEP1_g30887 [Rubroshorea leprosula]|uniref:Tetratricopeptide repeat protein 27 homolog n=1 Tax=Rubroshorea leprosula TaxID=152421 RepID=A0AAV5K6Z8_9ROSI|nr:hypothetical protein SLEP1_g30887 [Rubroshorea leprosula]
MPGDNIELLRLYELRLLRCTLIPPPHSLSSDSNGSLPSLYSSIDDILTSIESGNYLEALSSDSCRLVLQLPEFDVADSPEVAEQVYSDLLLRVESFIVEGSVDDADRACRVLLVLCIAVAAFFWFLQWNITGPLEELPRRPLPMKAWWGGSECVGWENWARNQLMSAGSDLLGKFSFLQYIVFAKMLLLKLRDLLFETSLSSTFGLRSISWWIFRVLFIHQRILDERSSTLFDILQVLIGETLDHFGTPEETTHYWGCKLQDGEALAIVSVVHLEAGVLEYIYGRVDSCKSHFESAEVAAGLQLSVTGVLGFRTMHQVEPKAQMVLVANLSISDGGHTYISAGARVQSHGSNISQESDIFLTPKLLESENNAGNNVQNDGANAPLTAVQQAVALAQCLLIEKSARHDEMQRWDMAPYIEAIDSQQSSYYTLRCFCDILRIRWESTRSRTKGRALEMMDKLVEGVHKHLPSVAERLPFCYVVYIPTIPALRKEYGELLISCGLVGEAIKIFEELELWDNLIYCNCLLGKKAAAVELIKNRLSEMPNDPRLWCSLGDVTNSDSCYEKALQVSNNKSARAKRSLARSAYNRGDYQTSKILWESAMALNSLYPDGWFALGAAALKARDVEKALDAFTHAVQLDPENGEAWNNIACLHMINKKNKESFIAFKEALKFKRDSWQLWENYSHVAFDVGNIGQALEAVQMVLNMTNNKKIDAELLEKILLYLEGKASTVQCAATSDRNCLNASCPTDSIAASNLQPVCAELTVGRSWENEQLMEWLGKILQQIVRSESRADLWGLYARWHKIKGDLAMCCEALLKQVRSYQGSDLWKDRERFKKFARASLELCKVYMEISSSTDSRRELFAAEMHLKNVVKQAGSFSDAQEYSDLQTCLDELKKKLQSESKPT